MPGEWEQLQAAVAALEGQRALLGDAVVDAALGPMRATLVALTTIPTPDSVQALRQVTILFVDVVGSTLFSQHLDPEEIHGVMEGALVRASAVVQAHHGKVLQYAGDNLLAAFGADEVREDDAERAVRCGLALVELGRKLAIEVQAGHGHTGFNVRVGIHTGGVMLGGGVDSEGTIRGIAVNIAARMEQTAPAGALRISHDTYTQVRGLFEVEVQRPLQVKGVDVSVQSYLVQRAKSRHFGITTRGIEGVATRMIGRDAELETLQEAFKRLFAVSANKRELATVTVVAEAGVGKSRLLHEFESWFEARPDRFHLFRGRATPQTEGQPYGLLRDILAGRLQIADDDNISAARTKLEQGIMPLFANDEGPESAEGHAHLLGHLVAIDFSDSRHIRGIVDDPKQIRNRAFHTAAQMFRRLSASDGSPVVLELEDLHWADSESLEFLNYLAETNRDVPMLVLGFARPTLFERRPEWMSTEGIHLRIDLAPLDKTGSQMLADELLKKLPEIPPSLRDLVTVRAEGNPFYMEELIKMLIDQRAIETETERWVLHPERLQATQVPPSLTGVLQARLDSLPARQKVTLQEASVIGYVFWDRALVALDPQAYDSLPKLVLRELVFPRSDTAQLVQEELREYAFRHHILHQVTYATVLKRTKRELHGKLAQWLAGQSGLRANDFLGVAAQHFEAAGDEANAAEFHARAAEHAKSRFAHQAVLSHVQRALELLPERNGELLRWRLLEARERALHLQGDRARQLADIEALEQLAEALADDRRRARVASLRARRLDRMGDFFGAEAAARQAVASATRAGDEEIRLHAQQMVGLAVAFQGNWMDAKELLESTLGEARAKGFRVVEDRCLTALGVIAESLDDPVATLELFQQALDLARSAGDRWTEGMALGNLGWGWLGVGDLAQAGRDLEMGLQISQAVGDRTMESAWLCGLSLLALWQGANARALELAHTALEGAVAAKAREWETTALLRLGDAQLALGRVEAAELAFSQAHASGIEVGGGQQFVAAAGIARVALTQGDAEAALRVIAAPMAHWDSRSAVVSTLDVRLVKLTCCRVLDLARDPRAADWLERNHSELQSTAARIRDDRLRNCFLTNVPQNREIVVAWQQAHGHSARRSGGGPEG